MYLFNGISIFKKNIINEIISYEKETIYNNYFFMILVLISMLNIAD